MSKNAKVFIGILLLCLGIVWTLNAFGLRIISFSGVIKALGYLWPLILIGIGLNLMIENNLVNKIIWVIIFIIIVVGGVYMTQYGSFDFFPYLYEEFYEVF